MNTKTADEYLDDDIREEFAKHHSAFRVCRALGISLDRVNRVVGNEEFPTERKTSRYGGKGRPEMEQYIVSIKQATESWDNSLPELIQARQRYEAGTHEMCQGRDGDRIILYSIPRAVPEPRPAYFRHGD
jgi:hypothetical protein